MLENYALLADRTTLRIQVYDTAPAELAGTARGTRLGALSDMAEELTAGSVRGYANWNTTLVTPPPPDLTPGLGCYFSCFWGQKHFPDGV